MTHSAATPSTDIKKGATYPFTHPRACTMYSSTAAVKQPRQQQHIQHSAKVLKRTFSEESKTFPWTVFLNHFQDSSQIFPRKLFEKVSASTKFQISELNVRLLRGSTCLRVSTTIGHNQRGFVVGKGPLPRRALVLTAVCTRIS